MHVKICYFPFSNSRSESKIAISWYEVNAKHIRMSFGVCFICSLSCNKYITTYTCELGTCIYSKQNK